MRHTLALVRIRTLRHNCRMTNHDTLNRTLGERMVKARNVAHLTQKDMAHRLGIGARSIINYEADAHPPTRAVLIAWAWVTGVPLAWLEGEEPTEGTDTTPATGRYLPTATVEGQVSGYGTIAA